MKKQSIALLSVMIAMVCGEVGCKWDDESFYNEFVSEDGFVFFCNPEFDRDNEGKNVRLNSIDCDRNGVDFKNTENYYELKGLTNDDIELKLKNCLSNGKCRKETDCQFCRNYITDYKTCKEFESKGYFDNDISIPDKFIQFVGSEMVGEYTNVNKHRICPKNYPLCTIKIENDIGKIGCVEEKNIILDCNDSQNKNVERCGEECVDISIDVNNCGGCGSACTGENASSFKCESQKCSILSCVSGFHLNNGHCIQDSITKCGDDELDCTSYDGYVKDKWMCYDGKCMANECSKGYHVYNANNLPCEADTTDNCGTHGNKCVLSSGANSMLCMDKKCIVAGCRTYDYDLLDKPELKTGETYGYHMNITNDECVRNSIEECGFFDNKCTSMMGWESGECSEGHFCRAKTCLEGYHPFEHDGKIECEAHSNINCGGHANQCPESAPFCLSSGNCTTGCPSGTQQCNGTCVSIIDNEYHCGACNHDCHMEHTDSVECKNSECKVISCESGYFVNNNKCEPNTKDNCGEYGKLCNDVANANVACNEGECVIESCLSGFGDCDHVFDNGCEVKFADLNMSSCNSCFVGFGDCNNSIVDSGMSVGDGCETKLEQYGLANCNLCKNEYRRYYKDSECSSCSNDSECECTKYRNEKSDKCVEYVCSQKCGTLTTDKNIIIPLCLKLDDRIGRKYCEVYCNEIDQNRRNSYQIEGEWNERYLLNHCSSKQTCNRVYDHAEWHDYWDDGYDYSTYYYYYNIILRLILLN